MTDEARVKIIEAGKQSKKVVAIKAFFEDEGGRKVTMDEFKTLTPDDKTELFNLAVEAANS